jgi:hypothetical protein
VEKKYFLVQNAGHGIMTEKVAGNTAIGPQKTAVGDLEEVLNAKKEGADFLWTFFKCTKT